MSRSMKIYQHCSTAEVWVNLEEGAQVTISSQIKPQQKFIKMILFHIFELKWKIFNYTVWNVRTIHHSVEFFTFLKYFIDKWHELFNYLSGEKQNTGIKISSLRKVFQKLLFHPSTRKAPNYIWNTGLMLRRLMAFPGFLRWEKRPISAHFWHMAQRIYPFYF